MSRGKENQMRQIHLKHLNSQPLFRIGLFEDQEFIDFRVMGKFSLMDSEGKELIKNVKSDLKWRIKIKESRFGKERFFLVLFESFNRELVEQKLEIAQKKIDDSAKIQILGGDICLDGRKVNNNTKYIITAGDYSSEMAARKAFKRFQPEFIPSVEKENLKEAAGQLEIFDAEYDQSAEVENIVRIVPEDVNTKIKIFGVRSFNELLQKDHYEDLVYNGTLEFRIGIKGNLMAVSEISLETYLKRVIYSEIGANLPLEFAKSLAIVARSEAMARIDHKRLGDPYDYCNTGKTLRYFGEDFEDETIAEAVEVTAGQVIYAEGYIRDTPFHLICGGHTEDASGSGENGGDTLFAGKYDWQNVPPDFTSLQDEKMVEKWIHSRPKTWCNLKGRMLPEALEKVKKHFRWEVDYSRRELEDIIRKKTGEDIGILFEIIPISRGKSGRLKEIELIGSLKNYRIRGEFNIREALAYDYLPSSCFLVEGELDETGTPISFVFVGAGHGHGVGMCKTGAAIMATEGHTSEKILEHYFEACDIKSIYEVDLEK
jgi:SpoIID/LytB domain protein